MASHLLLELFDDFTYSFPADERWVEWLDSKVALLIDREGVDPRNYGGKHYDE